MEIHNTINYMRYHLRDGIEKHMLVSSVIFFWDIFAITEKICTVLITDQV